MKWKIISVGLLVAAQASLIYTTWNKSNEGISFNYINGEKEDVKAETTKTVPLQAEYADGKVKIPVGSKNVNGVISGKVGNLKFFYYEGLERYAYINGYLYILDGKMKNGYYEVEEETFKNELNLDGENGDYKFNKDNKWLSQKVNFDLTTEDIIEKLKIPNIPLQGSFITKQEGQLPGSPREYRNGYHEGFDWYAEAIGIEITRQTPVMPIYDGVIVRIDKDYVELKTAYREKILAEATEQQKTSPATLDKLRGRQVWVLSDNGVLVRYAHLSSVEDYNVGDYVKTTAYIGTVGNSGTSNGALNTDLDLHLHSDLLIYGKNFWEYGNIDALNETVIGIFDEQYKQQKTSKK